MIRKYIPKTYHPELEGGYTRERVLNAIAKSVEHGASEQQQLSWLIDKSHEHVMQEIDNFLKSTLTDTKYKKTII